jgi:flagellar biosynthesis/type III secretory pathway chaperone
LISLFENEYRVYESILKLSTQKTDIVVEGKVSELENIVKLEQALILQAGRIENQRQEKISHMLESLGLQTDNVNISALKEKATPQQKSLLEDYQNKLIDVVYRLNEVNQINAKLIKNSLDFIQFSLNLVAEADINGNNYGNAGVTKEKAKRNMFDIKT